jgi:hypothetical protein
MGIFIGTIAAKYVLMSTQFYYSIAAFGTMRNIHLASS